MTNIAVERATFKDGLRVTGIRTPALHRAVIDVHVRIGSRYENAENNGISHFLEHMLHRGTNRHPSAHEQALAFEELGAALSAVTYVDHGVLSVAMPPASFERVLTLLAELLREPIFRGIEIEKGIVREEILEALDEDGKLVDADNLLRRLCFSEHALGFPITGTLDTLETFNETQLLRYHREHYTSNGMVISVAGPLDIPAALASVEQALSGFSSGALPSASPPNPQSAERFEYVHYPGSQTALRLGFRAPSETDPVEPAAEILLRLIDDGMATRLYHQVCDARGLCYDVSASYESYSDAGLVDFAADTAHERTLLVLEELLAVARGLRDEGPSDAELNKAKARFRWQLDELQDSASDLAAFYGLGMLTNVARTPEERLEQLMSVTREQVQSVAGRIFRRDQLSLVAVGNLTRRAQNSLKRALAAF